MAKAVRAIHQGHEHLARNQNGAAIGGGQGLAGVIGPAHQAQRRLHAGLAGLNRIKQDVAPVCPRQKHVDATGQDDNESARGLTRTEQGLTLGQGHGGEGRQGAARGVIHRGQRRIAVDPVSAGRCHRHMRI